MFAQHRSRFVLLFIACVAQHAARPAAAADQDSPPPSTPQSWLAGARRIAFLGDSITASGQYVAFFDAWLLTQSSSPRPTIIDVGLPSETVSGLSEEGHAGGKFPRPDLMERLDRVLALVKPDRVIACYGINCGIYQPFDEERFRRYQQGLEQLRIRIEKSGARLLLVTPPYYDDQRAPRPIAYNAVLDRYSAWLVDQRNRGWLVVDLHAAMTAEVVRRRQTEPGFTFQPDGVHPNAAGHWFMARQLIRWFGDDAAASAATPEAMLMARRLPAELLPLVQERMQVLRDAYVAAAGHRRPGVAAGLPVAEAQEKAQQLTARIEAILP